MTSSPRILPTLASLPAGRTARVLRVDGDDALAHRLTGLGFWPGTSVVVVRRAPFGSPLQCELRGYHLALRDNEAARVVVTVLEEEG